jgi:hypothetical protein
MKIGDFWALFIVFCVWWFLLSSLLCRFFKVVPRRVYEESIEEVFELPV